MGGKAIAPLKAGGTTDSHDLVLQIQKGPAER
jgi:hypothetical protein